MYYVYEFHVKYNEIQYFTILMYCVIIIDLKR